MKINVKRLVRLGWVVALTYLGVCVLVSMFQARLIYFPTRGYTTTPADAGLSFEDLRLKTRDGVSIAAWYIPHPDPKGSVLFCHGNAGNMSDRLHSIKLLHDMGFSIMIFDYSGFGLSEGRPTERGTYEDADAAWRYLIETKREPPERVVLFGRSLGGAVAIELAKRLMNLPTGPGKSGVAGAVPQPAGLAVESTFTSLLDIGRVHYPFLPIRLLLTYRYASIEKVGNISCPKLFMHGRDDTVIPLSNGRKLFEAAAEPKQFIETPGEHNEAGFTYSPEFTDRLQAFLEECQK